MLLHSQSGAPVAGRTFRNSKFMHAVTSAFDPNKDL